MIAGESPARVASGMASSRATRRGQVRYPAHHVKGASATQRTQRCHHLQGTNGSDDGGGGASNPYTFTDAQVRALRRSEREHSRLVKPWQNKSGGPRLVKAPLDMREVP